MSWTRITHAHTHTHLGGTYGERIDRHTHRHQHGRDFVLLGRHRELHRPHEHLTEELLSLKEVTR